MSSGPIRSSSFPAHEIEAIKGLYPPWKACLLEQDSEGFASFYTEDAVVMPPNQPTIRGRAEVKSWIESFPKVTEAEFEIDEVEGLGDFAFVRGRYSMTMEIEGAPGPVHDRGKYIEIRERQPDGSWLLARDIFNSDLPTGE
jgi:uncharacterized protein (TIGR02246 family)